MVRQYYYEDEEDRVTTRWSKKNKSKLPVRKAKVVSQILVDYEETGYVEIEEPLVDKVTQRVSALILQIQKSWTW